MSRFNFIYRQGVNSTQAWDQDLTPQGEFATIPSLGSLVPNWLLFLPRQPAINLASLSQPERMRLLKHAQATMQDVCGESAWQKVAYFEHGASRNGAVNGCGVDHAHLHAVVLPFDLARIFKEANSEAKSISSSDPWSMISADDYLLCMQGDTTLCAPSGQPVSQYFRRLIAAHLGKIEKWNYKEYPFYENINMTMRNFHAAG